MIQRNGIINFCSNPATPRVLAQFVALGRKAGSGYLAEKLFFQRKKLLLKVKKGHYRHSPEVEYPMQSGASQTKLTLPPFAPVLASVRSSFLRIVVERIRPIWCVDAN